MVDDSVSVQSLQASCVVPVIFAPQVIPPLTITAILQRPHSSQSSSPLPPNPKPPSSTMTYAAVARQSIPQEVKTAANPQGGMADPNSISLNPNNKTESKIMSTSVATRASALPSAVGLAEQMAGLDIREERRDNLGGDYMRVVGRPINQAKIPAHQHDERKLFVGGLPTHVTEAEFLQFFEQYGEVIDSVVMIDRITRRSRGFGFVTFAKQEVARSLLNSIPGRTGVINIQGKNCEIKASEPKSHDNPSRYVHGSVRNNTPAFKATTPAVHHPAPVHVAPPPMQHALRTAIPGHHGVSDRYYDSRDELYNGHHSPYTNTSAMAPAAYGYQYSGYQYSGVESQYPYGYGQYRVGGEHPHPSHHPQYVSHSHGGYYAHPASPTYSQYSYAQQAAAGAAGTSYAAAYTAASYYSPQEYSAQSSSPNEGEAYSSDNGSLELDDENYYEGVVGNDDGTE